MTEPNDQAPDDSPDATEVAPPPAASPEAADPTAPVEVRLEGELSRPPVEPAALAVDPASLQIEARAREQKLPLLQRIAKKISGSTEPFREIIVNSEPLEKRVALLVDGVLEKYDIERIGEERIIHSIYKGRIQNLENGLKAAFIDIGLPKNAFLHYWDMLPGAHDNDDGSVEKVRDTSTEEQKEKKLKLKNLTSKDIPSIYPVGAPILVQVTKAQIGTKGPRVTTSISIPGRYIVLMPYSGSCGISKKIEDNRERSRLKQILRTLTIPDGMGIIIRTAGEGKKLRYFVRDLHILLQTWDEIQRRFNESKDPCALYHEPDLIERTMRDFLTENIDRILVDNSEDHRAMLDSVGRISPRSRSKILLYKETIPIFERFNIERQIEATYQRKVALPGGGEIVIEETEALIAVDVNTGAHKARKDDSGGVILQVNMEAAREIARQIRLRNLGGLIILDFIDMKQMRDRRKIYSIMREEMDKDKAKTHILPISALGVMQMTRQRHEESTSSNLYTGCHYCNERGLVKSPRTVTVEILRRLTSVLRRLRALPEHTRNQLTLRVFCHPTALERLRTEDEQHLVDLEDAYNVKLSFRADPLYHVENFKIINALNEQELR